MTDFMPIIATVVALTALAWLVRKFSRLPVCPICVGVSGTWLLMLGARAGGFAVDSAALALLLGASVVGAAQWIEARLPPQRSALLWKVLALPAGFIAAYGVVAAQWIPAAGAAAVLTALTAWFLRSEQGVTRDPEVIARLREQMKKCC
jgi:hypothetical protein